MSRVMFQQRNQLGDDFINLGKEVDRDFDLGGNKEDGEK